MFFVDTESFVQVMRKQLTGTGAIRRQILLSKPKWEITKITKRQNTMRTKWPTEWAAI